MCVESTRHFLLHTVFLWDDLWALLVAFPFRESLNYLTLLGGAGLDRIRILNVCFLIVNCLLVCPPKLHTENTINKTAFREVTAEMAAEPEAAFGVRRSVGQSRMYQAQWQVTAKASALRISCSAAAGKCLALKMFHVPWSMLETQDFSRTWNILSFGETVP